MKAVRPVVAGDSLARVCASLGRASGFQQAVPATGGTQTGNRNQNWQREMPGFQQLAVLVGLGNAAKDPTARRSKVNLSTVANSAQRITDTIPN